jgi:hypothetical protein
MRIRIALLFSAFIALCALSVAQKPAGVTVRVLQLFLSERTWDHLRLRDRLQQRVAAQHLPPPGSPRGPDDLGVIGLIDETSVAKKGDKTPGVQRQHCGASGKLDNCIVTVVSLVASGLLRSGIRTVRSVTPGRKVSVLLTEL